MNGHIITFGRQAATIMTNDGYQYYAPFENIAPRVREELKFPFGSIMVVFKVDKTRWSGKSRFGPRYFVYDVDFQHAF